MSDNRTCCECNWRGTASEVLTAPNPWDDTDEVVGCPNCKNVNTIVAACDVAGCWKDASCGTPTPTGYRHTCFAHRPVTTTP
jgi:hypothetical protein